MMVSALLRLLWWPSLLGSGHHHGDGVQGCSAGEGRTVSLRCGCQEKWLRF